MRAISKIIRSMEKVRSWLVMVLLSLREEHGRMIFNERTKLIILSC